MFAISFMIQKCKKGENRVDITMKKEHKRQFDRIPIFFLQRGTSGIDIDLRRVDIDQCPGEGGSGDLNIFRGTDKCKKKTTFVSTYTA